MYCITNLMLNEGVGAIQKDIRTNYIQSITFYLDIIAVLPLEIFAPAFSNPWEFVLVLKLNRLLKLWKVNDTFIYILSTSAIFNMLTVWCYSTEYE